MYKKLEDVLNRALEQASLGKGKARHATEGEPFEKQKICEIARRLSAEHWQFPLYQAVKKIYEAPRLSLTPIPKGVQTELLGAIVYIAAAIILYEEGEHD